MKIKARGSSMLPFIHTGDYVTIKPVCVGGLEVGDIIVYPDKAQKNIICHRIVKIKDNILITKGDTYLRINEKVFPGSLVGKVVLVERGRRKIGLENMSQKFMASKIAWLSFHLPLLLYIIAYFIEIVREPHRAPYKFMRRIKYMYYKWLSKM